MNTGPQTLIYDETGFGAFYDVPSPPTGHVHDTLEISVFEGGVATMLYGGQKVLVKPDRLVVHWGMLPHQILRPTSGVRVVGLHIPLQWVLEWALPGGLLSRLLNMNVLVEPVRKKPCGDLSLLHDWHRLLAGNGRGAAVIVLLEVRARLMRMVTDGSLADGGENAVAGAPQSPTAFSRALRYIIRNFREPVLLASIAEAAGISPRHLTRIFLDYTGQTINAYITHLRVSHARRLLLTTDRKILDVMNDSGFSCTTQFYAKFREQTGSTPRGFIRRTIR
jgi:AraC-like DNA-binding protein